MKKQNKRSKLTRITLALLLILGMIGHAFILPAVAGELRKTEIEVHSWEELEILYQASESGNDMFLSTLDSLNNECVYDDWHMFFEKSGHEAELCLELFNNVKNRMFLIAKDEMEADLFKINIDGVELSSSYIFFCDGIKYSVSATSRNFQAEMEQKTDDPIAVVAGDGYSVRVWLFEREDVYQECQGYVILDGDDYPIAKLKLRYARTCPDDIPKEVLTKFGEFEVTTIERQLRATRSEQLLQIGRYVLLAAIPVVIVGGALALFAIRKKKEKAKESV